MQTSNVQDVDVRKILPDENQPRKYFAADKMFQLKESIRKHGIKVPLTIEDMGNGKYLLIDGERRYRSAVELGLTEVPAVIEAPKSEAERLIEQFSIQEQHESWTPVEKSMALLNLSRIMGKTLGDVCKALDLDSKQTARYTAFAELADKESFVKNEVPLDYATYFRSLVNTAKNVSLNFLKKDFTRSDEKRIEHQLTKMIAAGSLKKRIEITKIIDSFKSDPKMIEKFMTKDNLTPNGIFLEAKAQGQYHLRNAVNSARAVATHAVTFLETRDVKLNDTQISILKIARKHIDSLIALAE